MWQDNSPHSEAGRHCRPGGWLTNPIHVSRLVIPSVSKQPPCERHQLSCNAIPCTSTPSRDHRDRRASSNYGRVSWTICTRQFCQDYSHFGGRRRSRRGQVVFTYYIETDFIEDVDMIQVSYDVALSSRLGPWKRKREHSQVCMHRHHVGLRRETHEVITELLGSTEDGGYWAENMFHSPPAHVDSVKRAWSYNTMMRFQHGGGCCLRKLLELWRKVQFSPAEL